VRGVGFEPPPQWRYHPQSPLPSFFNSIDNLTEPKSQKAFKVWEQICFLVKQSGKIALKQEIKTVFAVSLACILVGAIDDIFLQHIALGSLGDLTWIVVGVVGAVWVAYDEIISKFVG